MQIEAIRAHPGSAHVMVYGTRRNPSCCMRGITTAPRACSRPGTRQGWAGEPQSRDSSPITAPGHPEVHRGGFSKGKVFSSSWMHQPCHSECDWLLGCERSRDGGGKHHCKHHSKAFSPPSQPPAGHCSPLALRSDQINALCPNSSRKKQSKIS